VVRWQLSITVFVQESADIDRTMTSLWRQEGPQKLYKSCNMIKAATRIICTMAGKLTSTN